MEKFSDSQQQEAWRAYACAALAASNWRLMTENGHFEGAILRVCEAMADAMLEKEMKRR